MPFNDFNKGFDCMASEKPNVKKRNEEQYYEPIKNCLGIAMSKYLDPEKVRQDALWEDKPKRVYLEVIGGKTSFLMLSKKPLMMILLT